CPGNDKKVASPLMPLPGTYVRSTFHSASRSVRPIVERNPCEKPMSLKPFSSSALFRRSRSLMLSLMVGGGSSREIRLIGGLIVTPKDSRYSTRFFDLAIAILSPIASFDSFGISTVRSLTADVWHASTMPVSRSIAVSFPCETESTVPSIIFILHFPHVPLPPQEATR